MSKIKFDMAQLDKDGLRGGADSLRSLTYEFCFPADIQYVQQLMSIDPSMVVYRQSPGRVQCKDDQYLGVGDTHQAHFREVLRKIAELNYVQEIHEAHFE